MSHFTKVETKVRDLDALELALKDLNIRYTRGKDVVVKGYAGGKSKASMSIHASKSYDIGVTFNEKGNAEFEADWWGVKTTTADALDEETFLRSLTQRYTYHKVVLEMDKRGYSIQSEDQDENGALHVQVGVG